jgi:hypothetical protein
MREEILERGKRRCIAQVVAIGVACSGPEHMEMGIAGTSRRAETGGLIVVKTHGFLGLGRSFRGATAAAAGA